MNLKNETIRKLHEHGKKKSDVVWVGCKEFTIDVELFWKVGDKEYYSGYGAPEVAQDLVIVGDSWWLERHEYDGSEWWEFKELPAKPEECRTVSRVITRNIGWESLKAMNEADNGQN